MKRLLEARQVVVPDGAGGLEVRHARVELDGARIVAVTLDPSDPAPAGTEDLGDRLLTPAFVNAHTHIALIGLRGLDIEGAGGGNMVEDLFFRIEHRLTPEDVRAFARVGALEALLSGTATVWDHYYHPDAVLQGLADVGMAGIIAPPLQDLGGPGTSPDAPALHAAVALEATERLATDASLASRGMGVAVGPHATDTVSDGLMRRASDLAERLGLPVHLHVAQSLEEVARAADQGSTPLGLLHRTGVLDAGTGWLLVHGLYVTDDEVRRLDPARHTLVACPRAQALFGFPAAVPAWIAQGASWVVASDAPVANDAMDVQRELAALARYRSDTVWTSAAHAAWRTGGRLQDASASWAVRQADHARLACLGDPVDLLSRVWSRPGALHPALPCGEIRPGALAHFALWDLRHPAFWPGTDPLRALALGAPSGALSQVMVAGSWRGERDDFVRSLLSTDDWREVSLEARERRRALLARL